MSDPLSQPDHGTQATANGFLFDDWNPTEMSPTEDAAPFDGKIIARMPDLGSNGFDKNIEKTTFPSFWDRTRLSFATVIQGRTFESVRSFMGTRQQFFHRVTAFGSVILLCGIGILFLDQNRDEPIENSINIVNILTENTESPGIGTVALSQNESAFSPVVLPEANNTPSDSGVSIPVADFVAVQNSVASAPEPIDSVGNRPTANSYSPWDVVPKHVESFSPSPDAVAVASPIPPSSPVTVAMAPMTPVPVPSMSMPVSPYERQLVARSNTPIRPPVDPFIQASNSQVPGMMPMHERLENMTNASPQEAQRSASASPPYPPLVAVQGGMPVNIQGHGNNPHGQYGQHSLSNVPIPSGVSTLPPQNGYYAQPYTQPHTTPMHNPTYRRVY